MHVETSPTPLRALVIHGTPIVAEDLRETLIEAGAEDVDLSPDIPTARADREYGLCMITLPQDTEDKLQRIAEAQRLARHVIVIVGFVNDGLAAEGQDDLTIAPNVSTLAEPFNSADVLAAVRRAGFVPPPLG